MGRSSRLADPRRVNSSWGRVRDAVSGLIDLLLPLCCAGCGTPGIAWCFECARQFGGLRLLHRPLLAHAPPAYALGRYRSTARRAVLAYKESGRRDLAEPFARLLATGLRAAVTSGEIDRVQWVVPAPSRPSASRRRGGAHMLRVANHLVTVLAAMGWSISAADCLAMRPGTLDSAGLEPAERIRNLSGRLRVRPRRLPPSEASVILIDDVITTGATVAGCWRELDSAGVHVAAVFGLTATAD
jgi:predicted amidophosphoribosyltransferase